MTEFEKYIAIYKGNNIEKIASLLILEEKRHILIIHNKCIFYSNDEKHRI